jgi:hypothetical protein
MKLINFTVAPSYLKGNLGTERVNIKVLEIKFVCGWTDIGLKVVFIVCSFYEVLYSEHINIFRYL